MAKLTAIFELIDNISAKLDAISGGGTEAINQMERVGDAADAAFTSAESGGERAARSVDGVATSAQTMGDSMDEAARSMDEATQSADYWTDAVGNYSKEALEAVYSTEELVEMGFKSQEALEAEAKAAEEAEKALDDLEDQAEDTGEAEKDMGESGVDAISAIGSSIVGAAIAKKVLEIAEATYELVDAFSEAEKVIVNATGATGRALDELEGSLLDAYAVNDDSLDETAAAIGEINTRLGYTGPVLTRTTTLFMDFADVTGGRAANSVKTVTQLMNQWEVPAGEMESLLDRLTYAGQVSGVSVDGLTSDLISNKAILDQLGFSLNQSIALFSQFEFSGTQSAAVMTGLRTALSKGVISSLEDLNDVFDRIATGELDAADAAEIFGGRAASQIVNAVNSGVLSLDKMVASLEDAEGTLQKTAEAGESLSEKWETATNSMNAAFTKAVEPVVGRVSGGLADLMTIIGGFLNEHPAVTKALTAVGVGVGVVAIGVAGVAVASLKAIPAVSAFGVALNSALGPIGWVALAITGITAGVMLLIDAFDDYEDETYEMTAATRAQYLELQNLNEQYEEACATYGETSEEALRLKYQVDDLSASFEKNRQTMDEFLAECQKVIDAHDDMVASFDENRLAINNSEAETFALIQKLSDLADGTYKTTDSQGAMKAIIEALNGSVEGLNVTYADLVLNQQGTIQNIKDIAKAQAEQQRQQARYEEYVALLNQQADEEAELAKVTEERALAQERANEANAAYTTVLTNMTRYDTTGFAALGAMFTNEAKAAKVATSNLGEVTTKYDELQARLSDTNERIKELEESWGLTEDAINSAASATISYEDAVDVALSVVQEDVLALCEAYDKAYESARKSIDGQIGLFDTMTTETKTSVADMQAAFESQIAYLNTYTENLRKAAEYGLDEGLIASMSDGSEKSAGYLNAIIQNIEELGASSTEAKAFVSEFNSSFQEVEAAKDTFADTVATMETDFDEKMTEIEDRLDEAIDNMSMETEAARAAQNTMDAYTKAIKESTGDAVAAAEYAAKAISEALAGGTSYTITNGYVATAALRGHAAGTTNAEDVFISGEEGPELIIGAGGSTVFPAEETRKVISAVSDYAEGTRSGSYDPPMPAWTRGDDRDNGNGEHSESTKKIMLELAGSGNIQVSGGNGDKEAIVTLMAENLKPLLRQILVTEIFEEGDGSYEY